MSYHLSERVDEPEQAGKENLKGSESKYLSDKFGAFIATCPVITSSGFLFFLDEIVNILIPFLRIALFSLALRYAPLLI